MQKWAIDFIKWCDDNEIEVPRTEKGLLELEIFEAKNKGLNSLHPSIVYLKRLRRIDLSNNVLKDLPTLPQNLITLILKNNIFSEFHKISEGLDIFLIF